MYFFLLNNYIHILLFIVFTSLIYLSISAHRTLLEYYLEKEVIEISVNEKNMSLAKIKFVFTRRVQYHLTGTFLQVSCLLLILYNFQKCIKKFPPIIDIYSIICELCYLFFRCGKFSR